MAIPESMFSNSLLAAFPEEAIEAILPDLKPVTLKRGQVINALGTPITRLYFISRGLASLVKTMSDGRMVEIGSIGPEGVTGVNALFDIDMALFETVVQVPGEAYGIAVRKLLSAMRSSPALHDLLEGYVHVVLGQVAQTAACNRLHTSEQRCCRWLLVCHDAARSDSFLLTQEFLSVMLGVGRVSVTTIAGRLQKLGIIRYHRGIVTILDRASLERQSCECFAAVKSLSSDLLRPRSNA